LNSCGLVLFEALKPPAHFLFPLTFIVSGFDPVLRFLILSQMHPAIPLPKHSGPYSSFPLRTGSIYGIGLFLEGEDKLTPIYSRRYLVPQGVDIGVHIFLDTCIYLTGGGVEWRRTILDAPFFTDHWNHCFEGTPAFLGDINPFERRARFDGKERSRSNGDNNTILVTILPIGRHPFSRYCGYQVILMLHRRASRERIAKHHEALSI
jgi:hypothetical protein